MQFTNTFYKNAKAKKRYVFNQGGTWSGKTYGELQKEILIANKRIVVTSCMSESYPHLRMGMIKDFREIMISEGLFNPVYWNKTESTYNFPNGSKIEFFSADNISKVHGGRRDRLLANEIQNISHEIFHQAAIRTKEQITADYNPTSIFWAHDKYINNPSYSDQIDYIHSTYLDNPFIPEAVVKDILTRAKTDENFKRVYIDGEPGNLEGLIFPNINIIDELPEDYKWRMIGLDFGFVNDPTAIIDVRFVNGEIYLEELTYETGLVNIPNPTNHKSIIDEFVRHNIEKGIKIVADSAEMKSIVELRSHSYNVIPAKKGKDSIRQTIDVLKRYTINVTKQSVNAIKEFRNYSWKDKKGDILNEPVDNYNHCIDPLRYIAQYKLGIPTGDLIGI